MKEKYIFFLLIAHLSTQLVLGQKNQLFDNAEYMEMVDRTGDHIYSGRFNEATKTTDSLARLLPNHPLIPMIRAMNLSWRDQPLRVTSELFPQIEALLLEVISISENMRKVDSDDLEGMFFEMSAHGLLTEYYAQSGSSMQAFTQAKKTYGLIKKTMDETEKSSELLFLAGLYNYLRETYPERHPVYKPIAWIFKSGDRTLGLAQLDGAVHQAKLVRVEASLYLSYFYLRYENKPEKAMYYLKRLNSKYPQNSYFMTKYLECLVRLNLYDDALPLIKKLQVHEKPYYILCGNVYLGIYKERVLQDLSSAKESYLLALKEGEKCPDRGEYYRSVAYLGLGKIAALENRKSVAIEYFERVVELDESDLLTKEAEERLDKLD